jgi:eukaryotic-like serine/threonine-protein kinase
MVDSPGPRAIAGRYQLLDVLGAGGMGVVYRGFDPRFERAVAIKRVRADVGFDVRQRFLREGRNTARARHPNIIEVFDVGETEQGEPFLVMELLDGESLAHVQQRMGRIPLARALRIAEQICDALEHAHARGLVHRDIKPENVFVEPRAGKDHVKVLDFGLAKLATDSVKLTQEGAAIGTLQYMAPEQLGEDPVDGRADQYAVAGVLYTILAGRPPFVAESVPDMVHALLERTPDPLSSHIPDAIPDRVVLAIDRALKKDPAARFATIRDFASALLGSSDL